MGTSAVGPPRSKPNAPSGLRSRPFALALGVVVALFMANGYPEQVYWDRELALILRRGALKDFPSLIRDIY